MAECDSLIYRLTHAPNIQNQILDMDQSPANEARTIDQSKIEKSGGAVPNIEVEEVRGTDSNTMIN